jgi:hypothetical protein
VIVKISSNEFNRVTSALVEKYGAPATESHEPFATKGGLRASNTRRQWNFINGFIVAEQYVGDINTALVSLRKL